MLRSKFYFGGVFGSVFNFGDVLGSASDANKPTVCNLVMLSIVVMSKDLLNILVMCYIVSIYMY